MKKVFRSQIFSKVSHQEILLFTKHLDTMMKAGVPIAEAFDTLISQTKSDYFRNILSAIIKDIENGQSLSKALSKHPKAFNDFYLSMIGVGEESGTLEENLEFLSKQLAKDYNLRKKIKAAMIYPALVVSATFIMGGFIAFYILPKLVDFFEAFEIDLPIATKILLVIAHIVKDYGVYIIVSFVILIIITRLFTRLPKIRPKWHAILLKVPVMGNLITYSQLARFSRNLGTLVKSGVPITKSLDITANTLSNLKFRNDLLEVAKSLTRGKSIGETLDKNKYPEYPPLVSKMISVGEKVGKLDETTLYLGDFYEEEIENLSKNLSSIIEPILLLVIGLAVGFVAIAIISPIYELTGSIRRK